MAIAILAVSTFQLTRREKISVLTGAVLAEDSDPNKQHPIGKVIITAVAEPTQASGTTDPSGLFSLPLKPSLAVGQSITLRFSHPAYSSLELTVPAGDQIQVVRLKPKPRESEPDQPVVTLSNVRVRYSTKSTSTVNIGSTARTFEVFNQGNVRCGGRPPCSPDGKWKAAINNQTLDTGDDTKQFRNARVSCIAGPCPFTRIESDGFTNGGRTISVAVRNWSDRVTYLIEAEVMQTINSDMIRYAYPAIFGRSMNFTLPVNAQGFTIEADLNGSEIIFPLGPNLVLSWATCRPEGNSDRIRQFRCELKTNYRFQ